MTTIHPETQIVASAYDAATRTCCYTYEHSDGSRYTIKVPIDEFEKIGINRATLMQRRTYLAQKIISHVQTHPPDHVERSLA